MHGPRCALVLALAGCAPAPELRVRSTGSGEIVATTRAPPPRAPSPSRDAGDEASTRAVEWRFDLGGPPTGPAAIDDAGAVYFATSHGYVFALEPDGRFRWSFTLSSPPAGGPLVVGSASGVGAPRVAVATTRGDVYAFDAGGGARWIYRAKVPIVTGLVADARGRLFFGGRDRNVHAVSPGGGGKWRAGVFNAIASGPVVTADGTLAVATRTPKLVLLRGVLWRRSVRLDAPVVAPLATDGDRVYVVAGRTLLAVTRDGEIAWERPGVDGAVSRAEGVLASAGQRLLWLGVDGVEMRHFELGAAPSALPAVFADGTVVAPTVDGAIARVGPGGEHATTRLAGPAALVSVDPARRRAIVLESNGRVASIRVDTLDGAP